MVILELPRSVPMDAKLIVWTSSLPSQKQMSKWVFLKNNFWGTQFSSEDLCSLRRNNGGVLLKLSIRRIVAMPSTLNAKNMNLNEYMITVEKPLGIRFAQTINGTIFVHAFKKGGNAEKSKMIMVGDVLKKISNLSGDEMMEVDDFNHTMKVIKEKSGSVNLVLERPVFPFPIQHFPLKNNPEATYNRGKVPIVTWDKNMLTSILQPEAGVDGHAGFVLYSSKFLKPKGWKTISSFTSNGALVSKAEMNSSSRLMPVQPSDEIVALFTEEESIEGLEWTYGSFPIDEYINALNRAEGELSYNHSLGMRYTKVTEHIYVGSCIQTEADVYSLSNNTGITAVLNLQCKSEQENWGIDSQAINKAFEQNSIAVVNCPIREADSVDLRRNLPFAVGVLYRLLRKKHRVFVTCTTGLDRSPACVIAYLHWIQDVALQEALDFVTNLHSCRTDRFSLRWIMRNAFHEVTFGGHRNTPDSGFNYSWYIIFKFGRPALVWATWDLIAMAEEGNHKGPPTHAVQFIWSHGCPEGQEVQLVGDFKGNWNEPIKAVHVGGPKYAIDLRLPQGKYNYKFIVGGQWRHSTTLPTETDQWGNVNNVIWIGDIACARFESHTRQHVKDPTVIKVIERPLTEDERFALAFAARRIAFSICPIKLVPKS